ncbi:MULTISPECIES: carbohydrate ABC transporter permease [unclassified Streptomyces]|uniref:carbohydrate ABC transporter permease n=1 Tax=unclassified Streptomyces TaxID=2593676 RepID=UPI002E2A7CA7|nr:carbohydrate ABC transporter permease [Streptomyces sp. NBC_01423]WSX89836.1 carbohydrate ABC transporter permease [Streptomyces sp. NBC_00891]WSY04316.1 carbohydrate ABC transporter permease [Streptomyces sp. NBC_00890]WSZ05941.1 carbohydrate ABC transporter permease [Streptomyces sp. NBC_00869]WSZ26563.1 carbohydrate ABC transporter permease [Streptomyces sp. NBC_00870]
MNTTVLRKDSAPPERRTPSEPPARQTGRRPGPLELTGRAGLYLLLAVVAVAVLLPFIWMVTSSLKDDRDVFTVPIQWVPEEFKWSNFTDIWTRVPFAAYLGNSFFLSIVITFLQVLTGSFAAYGFAKMRFPGRDLLFTGYIATIAVPWQAYMVPQYVIMQKLGLVNSYLSLILLQAFGAFGVFLMRQFYLTIPDEISEAARLDGLTEYGIWARIVLPLSKPALASLALLTFVTTWNDYMGPFIYLTDNRLWTVQLGLRAFIGQYDAESAMIMTGSVLSVLPILAVFLLGQRYFVRGIATTGVKG